MEHKKIGIIFFSLMALVLLFLGDKKPLLISDFSSDTTQDISSEELAEFIINNRLDLQIFNVSSSDQIEALPFAYKLTISDFEKSEVRAGLDSANINVIIANENDLALSGRLVNFLNSYKIKTFILREGILGWKTFINSKTTVSKILKGESFDNSEAGASSALPTEILRPVPVQRSLVPVSNSSGGGGC